MITSGAGGVRGMRSGLGCPPWVSVSFAWL